MQDMPIIQIVDLAAVRAESAADRAESITTLTPCVTFSPTLSTASMVVFVTTTMMRF